MAIKYLNDGGYTTLLEPLEESEKEQVKQSCLFLARALETETGTDLAKAIYIVSGAVHPWQVRCAQGTFGQNIPCVPYLEAVAEHCKTGIWAQKLSLPKPQWAASIRAWAENICA